MASHPLSAVVAFARVAHHASFTRAALELEVSASALSQTVRMLERQLGVRLFNRTTRRVALTEHGQRFLQQVAPGLRQIDDAFRDMDFLRDRPAGHLRINLPNVVAESLACGTPVAAFAVGGIPEMIRPGETGFLARPHDAEDLGRGICELLARGGGMRAACAAFGRAAYAPETVARRHLDLYRSLLEPQ